MPDHLRQAARRRHDDAMRRADAAIRTLTTRSDPISFASVAREAGVSTDFLYATPDLRHTVEQLRNRPPQTSTPSPGTQGAVRALTAKLAHERARHQQHITELTAELEQVHGENLELRRRLSRYE